MRVWLLYDWFGVSFLILLWFVFVLGGLIMMLLVLFGICLLRVVCFVGCAVFFYLVLWLHLRLGCVFCCFWFSVYVDCL